MRIIKICLYCGKEFVSLKQRQKLCSRKCSTKWTGSNKVGCNNPKWVGGKIEHTRGYVLVRNNKSYKLEHRLIMEEVLGRKLLLNEVVHHKNGIKNDNRLENLELLTTKNHLPTYDNENIKTINYLIQKISELKGY